MMRVNKLNRVLPVLPLLLLGAGVTAQALQGSDSTSTLSEEEARLIERAGIEMLEGWYGADPAKLERVLHPDLAKRGVIVDAAGRTKVVHMDKEGFVAAARAKIGLLPEKEWQIEAEILERAANTASVKVTSQYLVDICQVAKIDGEWRVVNVIWYPRKTPPWSKS